MNHERVKKYNIGHELIKNQNKLVKLQIENIKMQNTVLKELLDRGVAINLPIMTYNNIVLKHEQQEQLKQPLPPNPNMYL
jgi:hypothetical protein